MPPLVSLISVQPCNPPGESRARWDHLGLSVAELRGCRRGKDRAGHIGRIGHWFGKVPYTAVIEEFPDLVSNVSEVSSDPLALHGVVPPRTLIG